MRHTRQSEEDQPVDEQYGPEDGHVAEREPGAEEGDGDGTRRGIPELELGQAADERPELLVLLGRQRAGRPVLHLIVHQFVRRVELGLQKGEEEVEEVDAE